MGYEAFFKEQPCDVVCICGGHGYPLATATAARITMIGRTLQEAGISFRLLHCGPSPIAINEQRTGVFEGIPFEYTTSVRRPKNRIRRAAVYGRALATVACRLVALWPRRRSTAVYLYVMDSPLALYLGALCRLLRIPIVQEMCEWFPGDPRCSRFVHWLHKRALFAQATGVLAISRAIEERVAKKSIEIGRPLKIHRVPTLVDTLHFHPLPAAERAAAETIPEFVYCGTWRKDIFHLISTFALVKRSGHPCRLRIIGAVAEEFDLRPSLAALISGHELGEGDVVFCGCVDDETLENAYRSAAALLMPLWDDDRSLTRLPNKLGAYLASGRPVITCRVGDASEFLTDGVSAYLATPGDSADFASKMASVLQNPEQADRIGAAGRDVCLRVLDYRCHARPLADFFLACIQNRGAFESCQSPQSIGHAPGHSN